MAGRESDIGAWSTGLEGCQGKGRSDTSKESVLVLCARLKWPWDSGVH